jgi:O-antigen/teichoic acid export membrane protein
MSDRMKPILGALVTGFVVNFLGVTYFYGPIAAGDTSAGAILPAMASLGVVSVLLVLFYDWVNQQMGHPMKAALTVAVSQILLVDVYYALNGQRGMMAAAASAVLLLVSWGAIGFVYGMLQGDSSEAATG